MKLPKTILFTEFLPYFLIGLTVTLIDWALFWVAVSEFHLHYEIALIIAYLTAGLLHYLLNKRLTFKCQSEQIGSQLSVYFLVTTSSLLFSMGVMAVLVQWIHLNEVIARWTTTGIMLVPNYFLHKYITFSRKIFADG